MRKEYDPNKVKQRKRKPVIYVICEGKETEVLYFKHFRTRNCLVDIVPMTSKYTAAEHLVKNAKGLLSHADYFPKDGDQLWCVFDRDDNTNAQLKAAGEHADKNGYKIAYSNPSFEYWYLLHFVKHNGYLKDSNAVIEQLKDLGKPFIIIVNCKDPSLRSVDQLVSKLKEKHNVPVMALACNQLKESDILDILKEALYEFPISEIKVNMPKWVMVLDNNHWLKQSIQSSISKSMQAVNKLREVETIVSMLNENEFIEKAFMSCLDAGLGNVEVEIELHKELYHEVLKEIIGVDLIDRADMISFMQDVVMAEAVSQRMFRL